MRIKVTTVESELEFEIPPNTKGIELFKMISQNIAMNETRFFGIYFTDSAGDKIWIDDSKKPIKTYKNYNLSLKYRVKYYPEDVSNEVIEDITSRYFFLEVRSAILSDKLYCPPDTCVLLASYACQARHGDYNKTTHLEGFLFKEKLVPERVIEQHKTGKKFWEENIVKMWEKHVGMLKEEAMMEYLKLCQNLEMFGVHYYNITNSRGSNLLLGVYAMGLNVYKSDDRMNPKTTFPWAEIKNLNFRDRKFTIKPTDKLSKNFIFFVQNAKTNKRILKLGIGYHQQYVRKRLPDSLEIKQMKAKAMERRNVLTEQRRKLHEQMRAREEAEKRELRYQKEIAALKDEIVKANEKYIEAQLIIQKLKEKLKELEDAKIHLENEQRQLHEMMQRLEYSKNMEAAEKLKLEEEIRRKQEEVQKIRHEVDIKDEETRRLQDEVEEARRKEEQLKLHQLEEQRRIEEEKTKEMSVVNELLPELNAVNEQLRDQLKVLKNQLEQVRDESKDTEMDKIHRKNVKDGRDKYQTLAAIRKGNTTRRVDLFENL